MVKSKILGGVAHDMPADLQRALADNTAVVEKWQSLTPLARNEWICWTITVKQQKTREQHIKRAVKELADGKRRPCCWVGCMHRSDKPMNPTQKWLAGRSSN